MKYIDVDHLRAAIKEHTLFYAGQANLLDGTNTLDGYDEVLAIIDSLQQEQPEVFDSVAFQKGVQEGRRLEREEPVNDCHDLEKAARECSKTIYNKPLSGNPQEGYIVYDPDKYDAFKAGAEWQKAKMMEGAVEGSCLDDLTAGSVIDTEYGVLYLPPDKFCVGDKVKIIIVKEDAE